MSVTVTVTASDCIDLLTANMLMCRGEQGCLDMLKDPQLRQLLTAGGLSTVHMQHSTVHDESCR